jgi:hypothetical protein
VADIDRNSRLRLDAAARKIEDIGQDELRELGFEAIHALWIVRRTMIDMIKPIELVRPGPRRPIVPDRRGRRGGVAQRACPRPVGVVNASVIKSHSALG